MKPVYTLFFLILVSPLLRAQNDSARITKFMLQDHTDYVDQVIFSPNGKFFVSSGWDESAMVYTTDSVFSYHSHIFPHRMNTTAMAFSRDSRFLLTGGQDRRILMWEMDSNTNTLQQRQEFMFHTGAITSLVFGPSLKMIFSASDDGTIVIYDLIKKIQRKIDHKTPILNIAVSTDQRNIFVADQSAIITQYDAIKGTVLKTFAGHTDQVNQIVLSLDRKYMISASSDKTAIVWDLQKGKPLHTLSGHTWKVSSVDVSPDNKYVVTGSTDGTVKLWDIAKGSLIRSFDDGGQNVQHVAFNRDASLIAAGMHAEPVDGYYGAVIWTSGIEKPKIAARPVASRPGTQPGQPVRNAQPSASRPGTTPGNGSAAGKNRQVIKKTSELEISIEDKP